MGTPGSGATPGPPRAYGEAMVQQPGVGRVASGWPDLKAELHHSLQASRAGLLSRLEGLGEYDLRRPLTPTGTNLLGLVKHLAGLEYAYLGESFDRAAPETMSWVEDGSIWDGADMWATADETSAYLVGLYQRACAHADQTIADLDLLAPGQVDHWGGPDLTTTRSSTGPPGRRTSPGSRPQRTRSPRPGIADNVHYVKLATSTASRPVPQRRSTQRSGNAERADQAVPRVRPIDRGPDLPCSRGAA